MSDTFELETINKLYLELSQICTATTKAEIESSQRIKELEAERGRLRRQNEILGQSADRRAIDIIELEVERDRLKKEISYDAEHIKSLRAERIRLREVLQEISDLEKELRESGDVSMYAIDIARRALKNQT